MALTNTNRGANGNGTGATTLVVTPASNLAAGSLAILAVSYDNTGTSGADPWTAISDSVGNTWTSRVNALNDPGAAAAGVVLRIFTSFLGTALTTSNTITVTFGSFSVVAKTWTLNEITAAAGNRAVYVTGATAIATSATPTITTSSITSGDLVFGAVALEAGTTQTETGDADATNGSWSTQQTAEIGSTTSGTVITSQTKVTTGTATQTYNPTFGISSDLAIGWISVDEIPLGQGFGQAQADIKKTSNAFGQAQARIITSKTCYSNAVLKGQPTHYWRVSETGATATDIGSIPKNGTYTLNPTRGEPSLITGDGGNKSVQFDGISAGNYITVPDDASLDLGDGPFTIEIWAKMDTLGRAEAIVDKGANSYQLAFDGGSPNKLQLIKVGVAAIARTSSGTADNNPHHYVVTKNGASVFMYKDGADVTEFIGNQTLADNATALEFARVNGGGNEFDGWLDEIAFYNYVLSPAQVLANYNSSFFPCGAGFGQAQAQIVGVGRGFGQAQADIEKTTNAFGQAQADIEKTTNVFGQAQGQIKAIGVEGFGQSQADIKAIGRGYGQSQADIKATSNAYGQAQADIEKTTNAFGQSQADIKATSNAYGQSQADVKAIGRGFGQAQATILVALATINAFGQAQADIKSIGRGFGNTQADIKQTYPIGGGKSNNTNSQGNLLVVTGTTETLLPGCDLTATTALPTNLNISWDVWISHNNFNTFKRESINLRRDNLAGAVLATFDTGAADGGDSLTGHQFNWNGIFTDTSPTTGHYILSVIETNGGVGNPANTQIYSDTRLFAVYPDGSLPYGQAQGKINAFGQNVYGQAQAKIVRTNNAFGQAQADTLRTFPSSNSGGVLIFPGDSSTTGGDPRNKISPAFVIPENGSVTVILTQAFSQSGNIGVINTEQTTFDPNEDKFQVNPVINTPYTFTFNGTKSRLVFVYFWHSSPSYVPGLTGAGTYSSSGPFGQSQADIKQIYNGFGNAQANIKQTYNVFGQAQADIKKTINVFGQSQADIKKTTNVYGQAQAQIVGATYVVQYKEAFIPSAHGGTITLDTAPTLGNTLIVIDVSDSIAGPPVFTPGDGGASTWVTDVADFFGFNASTSLNRGFIDTTPNTSLTFTAIGNVDDFHILVIEFYGQLLPETLGTIAGGTSGVASHTITTTRANTLILQWLGVRTGVTGATLDGSGGIVNDGPNSSTIPFIRVAHRFEKVAGAYATSWTLNTSGSWATLGVSYKVDSLQKINAFGQAQATILAALSTNNAYGQAQSDIKQVYKAYGQSQADIKSITNSFGQAQADIKATINAFGQSQADIKKTTNAFGQSQADIKKVTNVFAQAQADIKVITNIYGQAQADIKQTYQAYGQAQADIKVTSNMFGQAQGDIKATSNAYGQAQSDIKVTSNVFGQAQAKINAFGVNAYGQAQAKINAFGVKAFGQAQANISGGAFVYGQAQAKINAFNVQRYGQSQADIKATSTMFGQSQADIKQVYNAFGQAQSDIKVTSNSFGQAQGTIKQTYRGFGQAQGDIKVVSNVYGQAQADIKSTANAYGQAQACIRGNAFGNAQADIKQTYQAYGNAQGDIKAISNAYGQAQASILGAKQAYGQSQADIKATYKAFGQSQGDIKATSRAYGQAQACIKGNAYGQAQADIKQTYQTFGQAQGYIKAIGFCVFGQAQGTIKTKYNAYGNAQGTIGTANRVYGNAQGTILATSQQYGQSQADVKQIYQGYGQAQADIKAISRGYGQAQADIKQIYNAFGNTQGYIITTAQKYGQAQGTIKSTTNSYGQSQGTIKQIYQGFGNAQADIKVTSNKYGQAQGYILTAHQSYGQAQGYIEGTAYGFGQAQAVIFLKLAGYGQAQAFIIKSAGYGQAQGFIVQLHQLQHLDINDYISINLNITDYDSLTLEEQDTTINISLSDSIGASLALSDRESINLNITETNY